MSKGKLLIFQGNPSQPRYKQIVESVLLSMEKKVIVPGDQLPSSNQLVELFDVSRDTVIKAVNELKTLGFIRSHPGKGYFIVPVEKNRERNIFLAFDNFDPFKQEIYHSFQKYIGPQAKTDIFFHHQNQNEFKRLIDAYYGLYTDYVIMPTTEPETKELLHKLSDAGNLILLDQGWIEFGDSFSGIYQNFSEGIYQCLQQAETQILKYRKLNLVITQHQIPSSQHICRQIIDGYLRFCYEMGIESSVCESLGSDEVNQFECYFIHDDRELENIVLRARERGFCLGNDLGVISFNESPLKKVVANGITTISVDFAKYGEQLADMIVNNKNTAIVNETKLYLRGSV